jgi:hypothetical protein
MAVAAKLDPVEIQQKFKKTHDGFTASIMRGQNPSGGAAAKPKNNFEQSLFQGALNDLKTRMDGIKAGTPAAAADCDKVVSVMEGKMKDEFNSMVGGFTFDKDRWDKKFDLTDPNNDLKTPLANIQNQTAGTPAHDQLVGAMSSMKDETVFAEMDRLATSIQRQKNSIDVKYNAEKAFGANYGQVMWERIDNPKPEDFEVLDKDTVIAGSNMGMGQDGMYHREGSRYNIEIKDGTATVHKTAGWLATQASKAGSWLEEKTGIDFVSNSRYGQGMRESMQALVVIGGCKKVTFGFPNVKDGEFGTKHFKNMDIALDQAIALMEKRDANKGVGAAPDFDFSKRAIELMQKSNISPAKQQALMDKLARFKAAKLDSNANLVAMEAAAKAAANPAPAAAAPVISAAVAPAAAATLGGLSTPTAAAAQPQQPAPVIPAAVQPAVVGGISTQPPVPPQPVAAAQPAAIGGISTAPPAPVQPAPAPVQPAATQPVNLGGLSDSDAKPVHGSAADEKAKADIEGQAMFDNLAKGEPAELKGNEPAIELDDINLGDEPPELKGDDAAPELEGSESAIELDDVNLEAEAPEAAKPDSEVAPAAPDANLEAKAPEAAKPDSEVAPATPDAPAAGGRLTNLFRPVTEALDAIIKDMDVNSAARKEALAKAIPPTAAAEAVAKPTEEKSQAKAQEPKPLDQSLSARQARRGGPNPEIPSFSAMLAARAAAREAKGEKPDPTPASQGFAARLAARAAAIEAKGGKLDPTPASQEFAARFAARVAAIEAKGDATFESVSKQFKDLKDDRLKWEAERAAPVAPAAVAPATATPPAVEPVAVAPAAATPPAVEPVAVAPAAATPPAVEPVAATPAADAVAPVSLDDINLENAAAPESPEVTANVPEAPEVEASSIDLDDIGVDLNSENEVKPEEPDGPDGKPIELNEIEIDNDNDNDEQPESPRMGR